MNPYLKHIISARWILSVLVGLTFSYLACTNKIDTKDVLVITTMVFSLYFSKYRQQPKE